MGVMPCARKSCPEILCHRMVESNRGHRSYICQECYSELCQIKNSVWPKGMTIPEMKKRISEFLDSEKYSAKVVEGEELDSYFNQLTGGNNDGQ